VYTYYTLYAGHREMEVLVKTDNPKWDVQLCTGVQRVGADGKGKVEKDGLAASWGKDYPDYGKKDLYKPEAVGLAVYVPKHYMDGVAKDSLQWMCLLKPNKDGVIKYYVSFCADMEEENGCHSASEWYAYLDGWKKNVDEKLKIKISK
jgi:hypothetical protein